MCTTWKKSECGQPHLWAIIVNVCLLPVCFLRKLSNIGMFSAIVMCFTLVSFCLIAYVSYHIYMQPLQTTFEEYGILITEQDRNYKTFDVAALPMFCATMMNIFEGNQQILNLYSEADKPKSFFKMMVTLFILITVFVGISVGVLGYMAFGNSTKSTILFNMPNEANVGIYAKVFYVITIMGSFVLVIQPIFHVIERS